jgi:hypothetical protein
MSSAVLKKKVCCEKNILKMNGNTSALPWMILLLETMAVIFNMLFFSYDFKKTCCY